MLLLIRGENKMRYNKFLKNKKAQEASTLTWVFATFLILIILIIYLVFVGILFLAKSNSNQASSINGDVVLVKTFLNFISTNKGDIENVEWKPENRGKFSNFRDNSKKFIKDWLVDETMYYQGPINKYQKGWIRIYGTDESKERDFGKNYRYHLYEAWFGQIKTGIPFEQYLPGDKPCDPLNINDDLFSKAFKFVYNLKSWSFEVQVDADKKVVVCLENNIHGN